MEYFQSTIIGLVICVASWIFAGFFWRAVEAMKARLGNAGPTKEEIIEEMELHNADEAGIDNQWTYEDAEYHLLLSDKYHKPEPYKDGA